MPLRQSQDKHIMLWSFLSVQSVTTVKAYCSETIQDIDMELWEYVETYQHFV